METHDDPRGEGDGRKGGGARVDMASPQAVTGCDVHAGYVSGTLQSLGMASDGPHFRGITV